MRILVNGEEIPEALIDEELHRVRISPRLWDGPPRPRSEEELRREAEDAAINRRVLEMAADSDPRPILSAELEQEIRSAMATFGCATGPEPPGLRGQAERHLRIERLVREFAASTPRPTEADVEIFYTTHRERFGRPEMFHAAHIVRSVNHRQTEEQALGAIRVAQAELAQAADTIIPLKRAAGSLFPGMLTAESKEM